ncbi:MAG TPA: peptidoglycan-associated lipoprotein Pal [Desulfuromonadales bacterium]|nr:peptidoglycan-associated lipoprotein Pal [Desulfuromonadales bacterium]
MKKNMILLLAGVSLFALLSGGCANKEVVKGEESVVPTQSQPLKQAVAQPAAAPVQQSHPTSQPAVVAAQPAQQQSTPVITGKTSFETVYFDFDKADLRQDARSALSKNSEAIKALAGAKVQIEGHCDERGSAEYNLALGERRAKSALQYLTTTGVKGDQLSIISYGKEKPAVQGNDESAWAKNRRAEFVVVK